MDTTTLDSANAKAAADTLSASFGDGVAVVLTNPNIADNPIVYLNNAFVKTTGYDRDFAIGRNCRFLQGVDTDPDAVTQIRDAVTAGTDLTVEILNYTAHQEPFWNRLVLSPLHDVDGNVAFYIGVQNMMSDGKKRERAAETAETGVMALKELQHRVKNHLAMIVGMVRLQAREQSTVADFATLSRRIETLQLLYEEMSDRDDSDTDVGLGAYLSRVANAIAHIDGRDGVRVNIKTIAISSPPDRATHIGFLVSEILTNALKHAFDGRDSGEVSLTMEQLDGGRVRIDVVDDGIGLPDDAQWPNGGGLGSRIVRQVTSGLDANLDVSHNNGGGTRVSVAIPLN